MGPTSVSPKCEQPVAPAGDAPNQVICLPPSRFIEYQGHPFAYDRLGRSGRVGAEQSRILLDLAQRQHALA